MGKNFRTRSFNTFFEAIFHETKVLQGKKKPDFSKNSKKSGLVPLTGQFSNLLLEGLDRLWEVHEILPNPKSFRIIIDKS